MSEKLKSEPVVLCILDGFGLGDGLEYDAVAQASTPNWDKIKSEYPGGTLVTSGLDVGLPSGQMGNSEVGHTNIGAGRVVMQFLPRVDQAFEKSEVAQNAEFENFVAELKQSGKNCHLMGLVSDGGVHAHIDHIIRLASLLDQRGIRTFIHAFTDGRDTPPKSGLEFIRTLLKKTEKFKNVFVATVSGRFYAMDRDHRWPRIEKAYNAIVHGKGEYAPSAETAVENSYDRDETDEFILPTVVDGYHGAEDGDAILFANFRSDRAREILTAILDSDFDEFDRGNVPSFAKAMGLVEYSDELNKRLSTLFPPEVHVNILGEVLANNGLKQLRAAETEKYPHVTFFFNNGREEPFEGEDRLLVPSPKVATYDLQPEMSAPELTDKLCKAIDTGDYSAVIVNFANPDMVGHTGDLEAVKKAVEAVDQGLGQVMKAVMKQNGVLIVTSDHGNAEKMWDETTNGPHTAHTTNLVPIHIVSAHKDIAVTDGRLADLAPTILYFLGIDKPDEMNGTSLVTSAVL